LTSRKHILVASTPDGQYRSKEALSDEFDLKFASTLREAQNLLEDGHFHMVIAGVHFDDSQMFELLHFVRSKDQWSQIPFVVIQAQDGAFEVMESIKKVADHLGATGFLRLHDLTPRTANKVLRTAVKNTLSAAEKQKQSPGK